MKTTRFAAASSALLTLLVASSGCGISDPLGLEEETRENAEPLISTWYQSFLVWRTVYADGSDIAGTPRVRITSKHGGRCSKQESGMSLVSNVTEEICVGVNLIWKVTGQGSYCRTSTNQPGRVFSYEYSGNGSELNYNVLDWDGINAVAIDESGWIPSNGNGCDRAF